MEERLPTPVAPFLRWAGGKRWLADLLQSLAAEQSIGKYYEPFLGGGAAFLALRPSGAVALSDTNADLIEAWTTVRDSPTEVAARLRAYTNDSDSYYLARKSKPRSAINRAARFIYLNHTSFNGIYRVNLKGDYNVPFGNRKAVNIPTTADLCQISSVLADVSIDTCDFSDAVAGAASGDFCFLDPPYTVAHNNNGFIKYNRKLFSIDDQYRLAEVVRDLSARGASFVLTNAAHDALHEMFAPIADSVVVHRKNAVGGRLAQRGTAAEMLYTNLPIPARMRNVT